MNARKRLSIKEKTEILDLIKKGWSEKSICAKFKVSKGTVYNIKMSSTKIKKVVVGNGTGKKISVNPSVYHLINEHTYSWFLKARSLHLPISGPQLKEIALVFKEHLGIGNFKASNGWLEKFVKNKNIHYKNICGDSASANLDAAKEFIDNFENLSTGYKKEDIFNLDETALFYKLFPNKTYAESNTNANGLKADKSRITVLFGVSAAGEKLIPLIIGKYKKPRCFKGVDVKKLPVIYESNKTAWMTAEIFTRYLTRINNDFKRNNRNILMLLDNCGAHPNLEFSNIKLLFLPPNTTSLIQPLDQGIIQNFKTNYRKLLVCNLVNTVDFNVNNKTIMNFSLLDAIFLANDAWIKISKESIVKTFIHSKLFKPVCLTDIKKVKSNNSDEVEIGIEDILTEKFKVITEQERTILTREDIQQSNIVDSVIQQFKEEKEEDVDLNQTNVAEKKKLKIHDVLEKIQEIKEFAVSNNLNVINEIMMIKSQINSIKSNSSYTIKTILDYLSKI